MCQKAFCKIHGFSPKCLQILRRKIEGAEEEATIELDKRGKHKNQVQVGEDIRELVNIFVHFQLGVVIILEKTILDVPISHQHFQYHAFTKTF